MRRIARAVTSVALAATAAAALAQTPEPVVVSAPDGRTYEWGKWVSETAPVAVLLWSSWAPRGAAALAEAPRIAEVCRRRSLGFVLVAVQEPIEESAAALEGRDLRWLHDRHGGILKRHRVVRVPALIVLDGSGGVLASLQPTADAVAAWSGR